MNKFKNSSLAQKTATIIGTALAALINSNANSEEIRGSSLSSNDQTNAEHLRSTSLKRKFVLKLNFMNPDESMASMHASHSSHSSHSSGSYTPGHASHASHASHVSSSTAPSYTPTYTPANSTPVIPSSSTSGSTSGSSTSKKHTGTTEYKSASLTKHKLGSRTASINEEGTDIKEIQELLIKKGYLLVATGYFDSKTVAAIKQFQKTNNLTPDGKVGAITLKLLQK